MRAYYGERYVDLPPSEQEKQEQVMMGLIPNESPVPALFDFGVLENVPLSIKLDIGGSAYWSEIAQMNTLDNLLMQGQINIVDYLERVPNGYISNQQELVQALRERMGMAAAMPAQPQTSGPISAESNVINMPGGAGYGALQRTLNQGGAEGLDLSQISM